MSVILLGVGMGTVVLADEEGTLKQEGANVDTTASTSGNQEARFSELSKQFNVSQERVTAMRQEKRMGWGEITISLAMARHLSMTSKDLSTEQALSQVEQLRAQKKGWGKIARQLGFKLGPVIAFTREGSYAIRSADLRKLERRDKTIGRPEKFERK